MGIPDFIRVAIDGAGKRMQTWANIIAGVEVHAEAVVVVDTEGVALSNGVTFNIPKFDYHAISYVGSTNNIATQVFKTGGAGGTTVATLTYAYVGAGAADDDLISSITQS